MLIIINYYCCSYNCLSRQKVKESNWDKKWARHYFISGVIFEPNKITRARHNIPQQKNASWQWIVGRTFMTSDYWPFIIRRNNTKKTLASTFAASYTTLKTVDWFFLQFLVFQSIPCEKKTIIAPANFFCSTILLVKWSMQTSVMLMELVST